MIFIFTQRATSIYTFRCFTRSPGKSVQSLSMPSTNKKFSDDHTRHDMTIQYHRSKSGVLWALIYPHFYPALLTCN
jgi:hypothetical protein